MHFFIITVFIILIIILLLYSKNIEKFLYNGETIVKIRDGENKLFEPEILKEMGLYTYVIETSIISQAFEHIYTKEHSNESDELLRGLYALRKYSKEKSPNKYIREKDMNIVEARLKLYENDVSKDQLKLLKENGQFLSSSERKRLVSLLKSYENFGIYLKNGENRIFKTTKDVLEIKSMFNSLYLNSSRVESIKNKNNLYVLANYKKTTSPNKYISDNDLEILNTRLRLYEGKLTTNQVEFLMKHYELLSESEKMTLSTFYKHRKTS